MSENNNNHTDEVENMEIRKKLFQLREEHRALDASIEEIMQTQPINQLAIGRLKREKLKLKDRIKFFEDQLRPDIIA